MTIPYDRPGPLASSRASCAAKRVAASTCQSELVVFEAVFTFQRRRARVARATIREAMLAVLEMPNVEAPERGVIEQALDLYVSSGLGFADAYHVATMERLGIEEIASLDRRLRPGIGRPSRRRPG